MLISLYCFARCTRMGLDIGMAISSPSSLAASAWQKQYLVKSSNASGPNQPGFIQPTQAFQMAAASGLNELGGAGRASSAMGGMSAAGRRGMGASGKRVNAFTLCARVGNLASGSKPIASCTKPAKTERRTLFQGPKSPENTPITSTG